MNAEVGSSGTVIRGFGQRRIDRVAPRLGRALLRLDERLPEISKERLETIARVLEALIEEPEPKAAG